MNCTDLLLNMLLEPKVMRACFRAVSAHVGKSSITDEMCVCVACEENPQLGNNTQGENLTFLQHWKFISGFEHDSIEREVLTNYHKGCSSMLE